MIIKFNQSITDYDWVLSFDIAKKLTGYSVWDFKENKIITTGTIDTGECDDEIIWGYFYNKIHSVVEKVNHMAVKANKKIFITKEKLPTQNGKFTTIDTLQGLAQAHAIFDFAVFSSKIPVVYDYEGIHSVSVKAYFKTLLDIGKPLKEDIRRYLENRFDYDFSASTLDVTDSLAVSLTLIEKKYNLDIKNEIAVIKKELKAAKAESKKQKLQQKIIELTDLMIGEE